MAVKTQRRTMIWGHSMLRKALNFTTKTTASKEVWKTRNHTHQWVDYRKICDWRRPSLLTRLRKLGLRIMLVKLKCMVILKARRWSRRLHFPGTSKRNRMRVLNSEGSPSGQRRTANSRYLERMPEIHSHEIQTIGRALITVLEYSIKTNLVNIIIKTNLVAPSLLKAPTHTK